MSATGLPRIPWWRLAAVFVAVIVLDAATKILAEYALSDGRLVPLIPDFLSFYLVYNFDGWLSMPRLPWGFEAVTFVLGALGLWMMYRRHPRREAIATWHSAGLAGGFAHVIERKAKGGVVDFIDVNIGIGMVTFNLADVAITFGIVGMLWSMAVRSRGDAE